MIAVHRSVEPDAEDRGAGFGMAHRDAVNRTVGAYERLFREAHGLGRGDVIELGSRVGAGLDGSYPDVAAEIRALARGAGADPDLLLAVNARTEILAGARAPECSVIGLLPSRAAGSTILAQNWDWHPDLAGSRVVWTVEQSSGRSFTTLTEAGILAKIGLTSGGLGACLNLLSSSLDGGVGGTPIHVMLRLVLERCDGPQDVHALLSGLRASASSCLTVGVAGELVSFEVSPEGVTALPARDGWLAHTNHFLSPLRGEDLYRRDWPDTLARLDELRHHLEGASGPMSTEHVKRLLRSHDAGRIAVCCHDGENPRYADRQATLASVVMHLEHGRLEISDGAPCSAPFFAYRESEVHA